MDNIDYNYDGLKPTDRMLPASKPGTSQNKFHEVIGKSGPVFGVGDVRCQ